MREDIKINDRVFIRDQIIEKLEGFDTDVGVDV